MERTGKKFHTTDNLYITIVINYNLNYGKQSCYVSRGTRGSYPPLRAIIVNGKKKPIINGVVTLDMSEGGGGSSAGYLKYNETTTESEVLLLHSVYHVITVANDITISLESEDISDGATIYEYSGELVFGDTLYTITWPSIITHVLGEQSFVANNTYIFNVLNDSVMIIAKA